MDGNESLEERVARLEEELDRVRAELRRTLREPEHTGEALRRQETEEAAAPGGGVRVTGAENGGSRSWRLFSGSRIGETSSGGGPGTRPSLASLGDLRSGEWWLARLGIGLVLFGVVLLFGYSVQRGWLTPAVQTGIGLAVGFALLCGGLYVYGDRRSFSRVLLGGGVGALYITGFAAFQVYSLVPQALAFGFMVAVTLLSCALSLRQDEASLSVIGAAGGLGTPFLLYTGTGSVASLVIYVCLILSGTAAVYLYKDWGSLLSVSSAGGWSALAAGWALGLSGDFAAGLDQESLALQLGVTFAWLLLWLTPLARGLVSARQPRPMRGVVGAHAFLSPMIALGFTAAIWLPEPWRLGWVALGGAALYALVAYVLRGPVSGGLPRTHARSCSSPSLSRCCCGARRSTWRWPRRSPSCICSRDDPRIGWYPRRRTRCPA